jgi:hypothetical protein
MNGAAANMCSRNTGASRYGHVFTTPFGPFNKLVQNKRLASTWRTRQKHGLPTQHNRQRLRLFHVQQVYHSTLADKNLNINLP